MVQKIFPAVIFPAALSLAFPVMANEPYAQGALLTRVAAMPEGSWAKVNTNRFSDVWPSADQRPLSGLSDPTPEKIILALSSYAWDSTPNGIPRETASSI